MRRMACTSKAQIFGLKKLHEVLLGKRTTTTTSATTTQKLQGLDRLVLLVKRTTTTTTKQPIGDLMYFHSACDDMSM